MRTYYALKTAPAALAVTLANVKAFMRIDGTASDADLTAIIERVTDAAERYTGKAFISQVWEQSFDNFPDSNYIELKRAPVSALVSFLWYDKDNNSAAVTAASYRLDTFGNRVILNDGYVWPVDARPYNSGKIEFTAGYGAADTNVPKDIQAAIVETVSYMSEHRDLPEVEFPVSALAKLRRYRNVKL